jgi:general stress protein YciG
MEEIKKKLRGFAAMSQASRSAIASRGGKAAHAQGKAHTFTREEAQAAGRKGGAAHSKEHLLKIGRLGGLARARNRMERTCAECKVDGGHTVECSLFAKSLRDEG